MAGARATLRSRRPAVAELIGQMHNPNAIERISVYAVEIPFKALGSRWVGREKPDHLDSTVVILDTGAGESCPIGAIYLPAFAAGLRAAIAQMAPALLGQDASLLLAAANRITIRSAVY